jgi:hypothetical protein
LSLRIAFDLDGVLADMEGELARQALALFGDSIADRDGEGLGSPDAGTAEQTPAAHSVVTLTPKQQRRLWRHVESIENFWETLDEIEPGSVGRLGTVAVRRRWEVVFLTRRPGSAGATAQVQTQRWLEARGFQLPSVYVVQESRGRIAAALDLDFVIDDRPENCLDVIGESRARAVLVWRREKQQLPDAARRLGIGVVTSVNECLDLLTNVDTAAADKPTAIDRVMRLLGLKQPAGA